MKLIKRLYQTRLTRKISSPMKFRFKICSSQAPRDIFHAYCRFEFPVPSITNKTPLWRRWNLRIDQSILATGDILRRGFASSSIQMRSLSRLDATFVENATKHRNHEIPEQSRAVLIRREGVVAKLMKFVYVRRNRDRKSQREIEREREREREKERNKEGTKAKKTESRRNEACRVEGG